MDPLVAARLQMAVSLGFHILFSVVGMAMPTLMVIAEILHNRTGRMRYLELARRWAKGTAILFAVGAVSGTVLSFELGLLWPRFMEIAGPLVGLPFTMEGFAFFLEGIFLGVYLYGWDKLTPKWHAAAGAVIALSGLAGGAFVLSVNGFMNTPAGLPTTEGGPIDPWAAFFNAAFPTEALHMILASYVAVSVVVLGIHAARLRSDPENRLHQAAVKIALGVALVATPLIVLSGDLSAKHLAKEQPLKLAAAESLFHTERAAPIAIGGFPNMQTRELELAIEIPYMLSFMAFSDPHAEVLGLEAFPEELWPPVPVVHVAFQIMVGCGFTMLGLVFLGAFLWWRRKNVTHPLWLKAAALCAPLGLIAVEAGWTVTEVGRQPWIIRGVLKTADAVTPVGGLTLHFLFFSALYLFLGVVVVVLMRAHVIDADDAKVGPRRVIT